ncbi:Gfo/Idh/MocA family oxidoreductase, partial [Streptomyces sp. NPDC006251]|uniref:Gfo/Idh/MocA family oxidoreductase n=1 Tax=Streptomyces sp. NPDC006251 TaxID=3155718 RepID=UPI0033BECEA3
MTERATLGVAVVGTGRMGADHVRRLHEVVSGARVVAVADVDAERAKAVAARVDGCTAHTDPAAALAADGVDAVLTYAHHPTEMTADLEAMRAAA